MEKLNIINNVEANRFEATVDGEVPYISYELVDDNTMLITHTIVPETIGGRGIAGMMTKLVLDYAKDNDLLVTPVCSYTASYINKHPEYSDLLKKNDQ